MFTFCAIVQWRVTYGRLYFHCLEYHGLCQRPLFSCEVVDKKDFNVIKALKLVMMSLYMSCGKFGESETEKHLMVSSIQFMLQEILAKMSV